MRYLISALLALFCLAAAPITITKPGTYSGTYSTVTVAATVNDAVTLDHASFLNLACNNPCNLTVTNCQIGGPGAEDTQGLLVWRFKTLVVEHNQFNGGYGFLYRDFSNNATSARIRYNKFINCSGSTGPNTRDKTSCIQAQALHIPNIEVAWNWVANERGKSAIEDAISFMNSGGTKDSYAIVHDNFVDGVYNWPVITPQNKLHFSGSGIMAWDPGASENLSGGGFTRVYGNTVLACENQAFPMAGSHDIEIYGNRAVNDGTSTAYGTYGYQIWNWGINVPATPAKLFATNTLLHDNFSYWMVNGKRSDWAIAAPVFSWSNTAGVSSEAIERQAWQTKLKANGVAIGPLPVAATQPAH